MKKSLVAFYSRTGNTRKIAKIIAKGLNADTDEIIDKTNRSGIVGWLVGGRDAFAKKSTKIEFKKSPNKYKTLILGTPIWAWTITPALREYIQKNKIKKFAFFCTCGGNNPDIGKKIQAISSKPSAMLVIKDRELDSKDTKEKIKAFIKEIRR